MVSLPLFSRKKSKSPCPETPRQSLSSSSSLSATRPVPAAPAHAAHSAPASPSSNRLDFARDFSRPPPSSVRHLRVLSVSLAAGLDAIFSPLQLVRQQQRDIAHDLPRELVPVVNLINAQRLRQYAAGPVTVVVPSAPAPIRAHAALVGTELLLQTERLSDARYLNVQDCTVRPVDSPNGSGAATALVIWQDFDTKHVTLQCDDAGSTAMWLAAFQLAKYEQAALNEAFTGVVLSLRGPSLSDIGTLLARKRFPRYEWCNMRLPQVLSKWVKVYVVVTPADGKKLGRVEIYTSEKMSKRSLVVYINSASAVYNVYPEDHKMIDLNLMMKLEGEVFVNRTLESVFHHDTAGSGAFGAALTVPVSALPRMRSSSLLLLARLPLDQSLAPPAMLFGGRRSRSDSVLSTLSFFGHAASPDPEPSLPRSPTTGHFFKKQTATNFVTTDHLYLMPLVHPGVSGVETMIRNWIHVVDSFRLYGRPDHLSSDKTDPQLMLFGLPHLPCYGYLSLDDAYAAVDANYDTARFNAWGLLQWKDCFKKLIHYKQMDLDFKGVGNIHDLMLSVNDYDDIASPVLPKHPRIASPLSPDAAESPFVSPGLDPPGLGNGQYLEPPLEQRRVPVPRNVHPLRSMADMPPLDDGFEFNGHLRSSLGVSL